MQQASCKAEPGDYRYWLYPLLCVYAPTYSVEFYIHLLHFLCIATINFDILNGVDTK